MTKTTYLTDKDFKLPDMGDYHKHAVDNPYMKAIDKEIRESLESDDYKATFYIEKPYTTRLGSHDREGVYFIKVRNPDISNEDKIRGGFDGDTLYFPIQNIVADQGTVSAITRGTEKMLDDLKISAGQLSNYEQRIGIRFLGIDAPEVNKYSIEHIDLSKEETTVKRATDPAINTRDYVYDKGDPRNSTRSIKFIKTDGKWREYDTIMQTDLGTTKKKRFTQIKVLTSAGEEDVKKREAAIKAQELVQRKINQAGGEVYFMIDRNSLSRASGSLPNRFGVTPFSNGIIDRFKYWWSQIVDYNPYRYAGYNLWGQDNYGRFLGTPYLKFKTQQGTEEWINLTKFLIAEIPEMEVFPDFTDSPVFEDNAGFASEVFDLRSYDFENRKLADAVETVSLAYDDRRRIQKEIFNRDFDFLNEWTVTIGDVTLIVPPTSIRSVTSSASERIQTVRSKGSAVKGATKVDRAIEMTLYFNESSGINGIPYEAELPNGEKITYHMNGLRALIAQFKLTPFLPIENTYINEALGIEAVYLLNLQTATVPGYPKLVAATLSLQEFDYRQYMPELPESLSADDRQTNAFARTINYEVMRWYYQRPILLGESLKGASINSQKYLVETEGSKTALSPMAFDGSSLLFYIANEEHLKRMLQTKMEIINNTHKRIILSDTEKKAASYIGTVHGALSSYLESPLFGAFMDSLNSPDAMKHVYHYQGVNGSSFKDSVRRIEGNSTLYTIHDTGALVESIERANAYEKAIDAGLSQMASHISATSVVDGKSIVSGTTVNIGYEESDSTITLSFGVDLLVDLDFVLAESDLDNLIRAASEYTGLTTDKIFNNGKIALSVKKSFPKEEGNMYAPIYKGSDAFDIDLEGDDMQFLSYCMAIKELEESGEVTTNESMQELKDAADEFSLDTLIYDPYHIGPTTITSLSCSFGNKFTHVGLNGHEGYAPQFMGGQDSIIEVRMLTEDPDTVRMIKALPRLSAKYARDYRAVIPSSPIKIDSDISRINGINEVLIESIETETVANQPGVTEITMRMVSVDRTSRNKEGLKKINEFYNGGRMNISQSAARGVNNYFDMNKMLAQAELYPDLELPTIKELSDKKFTFIRYSRDSERVYPDPDFYFVYAHILQSEVTRQAVEKYGEVDDGESVLKHGNGEKVTIQTEKEMGFTVKQGNQTYKDLEEIGRNARIGRRKHYKDRENIVKSWGALDMLRSLDSTRGWDISDTINVMFTESTYAALSDSYDLPKTEGRFDSIIEGDSDGLELPGEWASMALTKARKAGALIEDFLMSSGLKSLPSGAVGERSIQPNTGTVKSQISTLLKDARIEEAFELIGIEDNRKFRKTFENIVWSAACAATSTHEFRGKKLDSGWKPAEDFVAVRAVGAQDRSGIEPVSEPDAVAKDAVEFGAYRNKLYTKDEIEQMTGNRPGTNILKDAEGANKGKYVLDPYYRRTSTKKSELENYKKAVAFDFEASTEAFLRNMLVWIVRSINDRILPSIGVDIMNEEFKEILSEVPDSYGPSSVAQREDTGQGKLDVEKDDQEIAAYIDFLSERDRPVDMGKVFFAALMGITDSQSIYQAAQKRDYNQLNALVETTTGTYAQTNAMQTEDIRLRKMLLALVGLGEIKEGEIGNAENPLAEHESMSHQMKYIEAAEDPAIYTKHAFHDMVTTDMRGRMARAFPTFYVVFVDEGREIGLWKLHDNFYNISSIAEIQVAKSRKNPADTCRLVVSNMYQTLTTDDEDANLRVEYDWRDVFDSIFNPRAYYLREEGKRMSQPPINRARLTEGTRIHVRMGYGGNAATLPAVFNGMIAEVSAGDLVEVVAQGDGVELTNPIMDDTDADAQKNSDELFGFIKNMFNNASTPKEIIDAFLSVRPGWFKNKVRNMSDGLFYNDNPFGMSHFGSSDYFTTGNVPETTQNIYEAMSRPKWTDEQEDYDDEMYNGKEAPKISIETFGKTIWDILNIVQSVSPDFIIGIAPFGFRSTIFHGHPRFYYAYDYEQNEDGSIREKRKPYQQYHMYSSYSDIIKNDMRASSRDTKTNAVGLYKRSTGFGSKNEGKTSRIWVDKDIYPDFQRSMVYDTQMYAKGIPIVGSIPFVDKVVGWAADDEGALQGAQELAFRMTVSGLKDTIKDMYTGEIILMGDPSLKPHDRAFIYDAYEDMNGAVLVESCVHSFSVETGYTTSFTPDCIAVVDDRHEMAVQNLGAGIFSTATLAASSLMIGTMVFGGGKTPLLSMGKGMLKSNIKSANALLSKTTAGASATKAVGKAATGLKGLASKAGMGAAAGSLGGPQGAVIGAVAAVAVELGTYMTISSGINRSLSRYMRANQAVQIFPIKKHKRVLVSGMSGSKGVIYGAPSYNERGAMDSIFSKLFNPEEEERWGVLSAMTTWLASDEIKSIAMANSASIVEDNESGEVAEQKRINNVLHEMSKDKSRRQAGFQGLIYSRRLNPKDADYEKEIARRFNDYAFLDTESIHKQSRIVNDLAYLMHDPVLIEAKEEGILDFVWGHIESRTRETVQSFNINGRQESVSMIHYRSNYEDSYDIPFLRGDALNVVKEVLRKHAYFTGGLLDEEKSDYATEMSETSLQIVSALRVGDSHSFSSTGFSFVIEAEGPRGETIFHDIMTSIDKDVKAAYDNGGIVSEKVFDWDVKGVGKTSSRLFITVYPPR